MKWLKTLAACAALAMLCAMPAGADTYTIPYNNAFGPYPLQSAATTGNGDVLATQASTSGVLLYLTWSAGCSAGAVTFETASAASYAGTWAPLATVSWSAASKADVIQITAPVGVIRARVSTTIVGGTVTVTGYGLRR